MLPFSMRELELTKNDAYEKIQSLKNLYMVGLVIEIVEIFLGATFLIVQGINSCKFQGISTFICISILVSLFQMIDMFFTIKSINIFQNNSSLSADINQNSVLKSFLLRVERQRTLSSSNNASLFQVREILWEYIRIPISQGFFVAQLTSWVLYGISFYFGINSNQSECIFQKEYLVVFTLSIQHSFIIIGLLAFSIALIVSFIIFIPFLIFAYLTGVNKPKIKDNKQEISDFLNYMFSTELYNSQIAKDNLCSICLENFKEKQPIKQSKCCHSLFHPSCIQKWASNRQNCPNCRRQDQIVIKNTQILPQIQRVQQIASVMESVPSDRQPRQEEDDMRDLQANREMLSSQFNLGNQNAN